MPEKAKITTEIPAYLKEWIDAHDIGQNALVTIGLRNLRLQEKQADESLIFKKVKDYFESIKLPF
jgi:hypothetical protein